MRRAWAPGANRCAKTRKQKFFFSVFSGFLTTWLTRGIAAVQRTVVPGTDDDTSSDSASSASSASSSTSDRYKTELCRSWEETRACRYGAKCQFAHGVRELREMPRHPKYKTELCKNFHARGSCPYGARCRFIHDELDHDRQLVAALGPARVAELRRMLLSPALLQSPAISPVTSPRLQRRTKSNPISPIRSLPNSAAAAAAAAVAANGPAANGPAASPQRRATNPTPQPSPVRVPYYLSTSPTVAAAAFAAAAAATVVPPAPTAAPPTTTAAPAAPVLHTLPSTSPARPMQFQLLSNVHASHSASSSSASEEDDDDECNDDSSDSVDAAAIAAAALAEPEPPRNVPRSQPRLVPQRLFVDRTESAVAPLSPFVADLPPAPSSLLSEQDARDIDQLVAELSSSLESDTPGQWAKREKRRTTARLPIFAEVTHD